MIGLIFSGWLKKSRNTNVFKQAHCLVCCKDLRAHHGDLQKHSSVSTHVKNMESIQVNQKKISEMCTNTFKEESKMADLELSVFIACHASISSIDCLVEILNKRNKKDQIKLGRTKCTNLLKYVVAPNILQDMVNDVGDASYSLIVDESTVISQKKYLCLCIKYFSLNQNRTVTNFLGLIELHKADAKTLYSLVIKFLEEINLPLINLIGLGTDGGSNLCGKNNSLYTLLRADVPKLQLIRCVCHALNLAASAAADEFPASVEFLLREVYNWFIHSPNRKSDYMLTWNTLNKIDDEENSKDFRQFVKLSATRWLARYNAVKIILEHYFELKVFFDSVTETEKCYSARTLQQMLNDTANYLFLKIVKPILYEVNEINLLFQRETIEIATAYDELKDLILLLARKILKPSFMSENVEKTIDVLSNEKAFLSPKDADYGIEYSAALLDHKISEETRAFVEDRAFKYIKQLCLQLGSRLPKNMKYFERLKSLSPSVCLSQIRPKFKDLPFLNTFAKTNELGSMENQYSRLLTINWSEFLNEETLTDSYKFWAYVCNFKTAGNKYIFRELALFVLTVLSLPSSNAVVERVFSVMNAIKSKSRNRMLLTLLVALLRIKTHFFSTKTCCRKFDATDKMLKDFNSKYQYQYESANAQQDQEESCVRQAVEILDEYNWPCICLPETF